MDSKTQDMLVGLAKDWLTGGVSAGVSKTAVAPIGTYNSRSHWLIVLFKIMPQFYAQICVGRACQALDSNSGCQPDDR